MESWIDAEYLEDVLLKLLRVHSPAGYTDPIVRVVCGELDELGIDYELTRRGAIRATLDGEISSPDRAIVTHLDTLGGMVKVLKPNGRLGVTPVGTWSSRFAEGARCSVFTDDKIYRGQILPLKASGHIFNEEIDSQPISWENVEIRIDENVNKVEDLNELGIRIGDFVGIDAQTEILPNGYINSRHLDDKAGVASVLAAVKFLKENEIQLPCDCHLLFTISEEVGSGASAVLHGDIAEMVTIDNGTAGPGQATREHGVTVVMADSSGPFDYHLTHHLLFICEQQGIPHVRDIFKFYRCDSASAVEAGNDIRTSLIAFGLDGSHGWERTTMDSLVCTGHLAAAYAMSEPLYRRQTEPLINLRSFPETRKVDVGSKTQTETEPIAQTPPDECPRHEAEEESEERNAPGATAFS